MTDAEAAELARWRHGRQSVPDWLASQPDPDKVRASLVRALDRPNRGGAFGRALAAYLGADLDALHAEHHPRKAARLAADCRARGDHPHADKLHAALVALMFCANCGRPLVDPLSIDRGIGPDCPTAGRRSTRAGAQLSATACTAARRTDRTPATEVKRLQEQLRLENM